MADKTQWKPKALNLSSLTNKELIQIIKHEGELVNKAFRRIEKEGYTEASQAYQYNIAKAFDDKTQEVYRITSAGKFAYSLKTQGLTHNQLVSKATEIRRTYQAKSSTVTGMKNMYSKAAKTISDKYKLDRPLTPAEVGALFRAAELSNYTDRFSSDEVIMIYKKSGMTADKVADFLEKSHFDKRNTFNSVLRNLTSQKKTKATKHLNK